MSERLLKEAQRLRQLVTELTLSGRTEFHCSVLLPLVEALPDAEAEAERARNVPNAPEESFTEEEAAKRLGVSRDTLARRRKAGTLKTDIHYCWRLGQIKYTATHLRRIQGLETERTLRRVS